MEKRKSYTINIDGELLSLDKPVVMGILNATPDSFYSGSRFQCDSAIAARAVEIVEQGGWIIDIGAYSSRHDSVDISPEEEWQRLEAALKVVRKEVPQAVISVDTFRSDVARKAVEHYGVNIINDISGGAIDKEMFQTIADLKVPYILMHMVGTPQTMMQHTHYYNFMEDVMLYFSRKVNELRLLGVNDIIIDPGFGFSKTLEDNYKLMAHLEEFAIFDLPILSGISRKSMIYKLLGVTPQQSLNGTTVLNTLSLMAGAHILRVHDVREAVETVKLVETTKHNR